MLSVPDIAIGVGSLSVDSEDELILSGRKLSCQVNATSRRKLRNPRSERRKAFRYCIFRYYGLVHVAMNDLESIPLQDQQ